MLKLSHHKYESLRHKSVKPQPETVLTISVPLDILSFSVSLPISAVIGAPAQCVGALHARLIEAKALPAGISVLYYVCLNLLEHFYRLDWLCVPLCWTWSPLVLSRFRYESSQAPELTFSVQVGQDFTWMLFFCEKQVLSSYGDTQRSCRNYSISSIFHGVINWPDQRPNLHSVSPDKVQAMYY